MPFARGCNLRSRDSLFVAGEPDWDCHLIDHTEMEIRHVKCVESCMYNWLAVFGILGIGACSSPSGPSAIPSGRQTQGAEFAQPSSRDVSSGLQPSTLSQAVTDATLLDAGWSCIEPGIPGVTLCAPPGTGLPPMLPSTEGQPSYTLAAFVNHQFNHHVKLLRHDLYRGQPCLGGGPWLFLDFLNLNYHECIIPVR